MHFAPINFIFAKLVYESGTTALCHGPRAPAPDWLKRRNGTRCDGARVALSISICLITVLDIGKAVLLVDL